MKRMLLVSALALLLSACGTSRESHRTSSVFGWGANDVNMAGAAEILPFRQFERVDALTLLDPNGLRNLANCPAATEDGGLPRARCEVDAAFRAFYDARYNTAGSSVELRRNQVQDRIIAASEQRCQAYRLHLTRNISNTNFYLGAATSIFAGAGAAFTEPSTVRALAAMAGITSGVSAEFNRSYLHTLTLQVISRGIEARRMEIRNEIERLRGTRLRYGPLYLPNVAQTQPTAGETTIDPAVPANATSTPTPIDVYTMERAFADALRYHAACSVTVGLEEAQEALDEAESPSLSTLNHAMETLVDVRAHAARLVAPVAQQPQTQDPAPAPAAND